MSKTKNNKPILCAGHLVYDIRDYVEQMPQIDKTTFMYMPPQIGPGGSAANVALNCVKLKHNAALIANVGDDPHGKFLLKELKKSGLDTSQIKIIKDGRTGLSVILIDRTGQVMVIEDKGCIEDRREFDEKKIANSCWLHLTGTSLYWLEKISKIAHKNSIPISFDPGRAASRLGAEKLAKILERAEYLIVNKKELEALSGSASEESAKNLSKEFNLFTIVKNGHNPVFVCTTINKTFYVEPYTAPYVIDTLGAGDAFASGLICGKIEGMSLVEAIKFGHAAAAAKVMHPGAQGMPKRESVLKHFKL
ncbi:MAG: carbohydrate kinase family protein [Candidatus Micrarchaeota archaeon]|nr:carbohydrate kinase family protein [Candidatus Micrarchaeota archaeon]